MAGVVTIPDAAERQTIRNLYALHGGNISAVARATGRDRATVRKVLSEGEGESESTDGLQWTPELIEALRKLGSGIGSQQTGIPIEPQQTGIPIEPQQTGMPAEVQQTGIENLETPFPGIVHPRKQYARIAWMADLHIPYHDSQAIGAALNLMADWGPDLIVMGGDLYDCKGAGRWDKSPEAEFRLQSEFDTGKQTVKDIDSIGADVECLEGNHEHWLQRNVIWKNPSLSKMRALSFPRIAELPERWVWNPNQTHFRLGNLLLMHGDMAGRGSGGKYPAANIANRMRTSVLMGHWHRRQSHDETAYDGTVRGGWSVGCLCDPTKMDYVRCPDWQQGIALIDYDHPADVFQVHNLLIVSGKVRFNGKTYSG